MSDEINYFQSIPQVEQSRANFILQHLMLKAFQLQLQLPLKETSFIPPPLSIVFRPLSVRSSTPIQIIFLDVPSRRMNQSNYMSFIPTQGCPTTKIRRSEIWDMLCLLQCYPYNDKKEKDKY
ncbi:hypothetical protein HKD37_09G025946 [Glycine soja]